MKKILNLFLALTVLTILNSCSKDDDSNNLRDVKIVITEGSASLLNITPVDEELYYEDGDLKEYQNTNNVAFTLPSYTHHFYLEIQGSQQIINGYVEINGKKWEFNTPDWYYEGTYYLSDFE
ncbi:MAG: hypothetical protein IE891_09615 [Flavobacteriaceae bacterium]|nr:hypothetical protein [Flavobacteriaceae bacterium]